MPRPAARNPWPVAPDTPLAEVPFCVLDIETTGSGPHDTITEIGAVRVRGGALDGTFQTLVNPGRGVSPFVTLLTGITDTMLAPAPRIEAVLPAFIEFARGCVVVGHNVSFDLGFLDRACEATSHPLLARPAVDTLALARRLLRADVTDCRLGTLADHLHLAHRPTHRALDDALATTDLLHALIERCSAWDVRALDDLVQLPRLGRHPQAAKLRLTTELPRSPGVYRFVDRAGTVLYVGTATNLRSRVRSYFGSDDRRMVQPLLRSLHTIDHTPLPHPLLAQVLEVRELHRLRPRFNRRGARPQAAAYVELTAGEPFPRLRVVRRPGARGTWLGPVPSSAAATRVVEALHHALALRRCSAVLRQGAPTRDTPCLPGQLGVAACPCAGMVDADLYARAVETARRVLAGDGAEVVPVLEERVARLAAQRRFEEAALTRDRLTALTAALDRRARLEVLLRRPRFELELAVDGEPMRVAVDRGRIVGVPGLGEAPEPPPPGRPAHPAFADEALVISRWLSRRAAGTAHATAPDPSGAAA